MTSDVWIRWDLSIEQEAPRSIIGRRAKWGKFGLPDAISLPSQTLPLIA